MMVPEVEVPAQRLRDPDTPAAVARRASERLRELQAELADVRDDL